MSVEKDYKLLYGTILNMWLKYCCEQIPTATEALAIPNITVMATQLFGKFSKETKTPFDKDYFNRRYSNSD